MDRLTTANYSTLNDIQQQPHQRLIVSSLVRIKMIFILLFTRFRRELALQKLV